MSGTILIVEDERVLREALASLLESEGYTVFKAANGREAYELVIERPVDVVLSDVRMPEMDGMELLRRLRQTIPETPVIILTAFGSVETAVEAMREGATDYLIKPVQFDEVLLRVARARDTAQRTRERRVMTEQLAAEHTFHNIVSEARNMRELFEKARKLSDVKSTVLILGESGTGKELFARAIHYNSVTRDKPFVAVNCAAIPDTLIESELFGHRKGSFTSATRDKVGYFEAAHGGTLFLDEISTLPRNVQGTLLRVLEDRTVVPVGDTKARPVDIRVIAATNQDMEEQVRNGEFREDLYYRLNVVSLTLPPLRERREDIPLLVQHFLDKYTRAMNKRVLGVSNGAMRALLAHDWRGNVRELENVIERVVIFAEDRQVELSDLPFASPDVSEDEPGDAGEDLRESMRAFERQHILQSLKRHDYDKPGTARHLGIGVSSLYRKMEELGIPKDAEDGAPGPDQTEG